MMKRIFVILVLLITILPGCEFLLDYKISTTAMEAVEHEPKLCVYARYFADKGLNIKVYHTRSISAPNKNLYDIPEANVRLLRTNGAVCLDTTVSLVNGMSFIDVNKFSVFPQNGDSLTIFIEADGYDAVTGKTMVPLSVTIDTILVKKYYSDTKMYRFTLFFTDPSIDNFYLVSSVYHLTTFTFPVDGYGSIYDTTYSKIRLSVNLTDPVFDFMPDFRTSVKEPFNNSYRKPRIFSDEGFKNSEYGLNIEVPESDDYYANRPYNDFSSTYELELYSISKDLFEAFKSSYLNEIIEGDIYAEPVYIYSNMSNKVGFFGAYSKKSALSVQIDNGDVLDHNNNKNPELYL